MRVTDAMALVTVDTKGAAAAQVLGGLMAAFHGAGLPVVHVVDTKTAEEVVAGLPRGAVIAASEQRRA